MWNRLPDWVVSRLDHYWQHQDIVYDFQAQIQGTGNQSEFFNANQILFL